MKNKRPIILILAAVIFGLFLIRSCAKSDHSLLNFIGKRYFGNGDSLYMEPPANSTKDTLTIKDSIQLKDETDTLKIENQGE